MGDSLSDRLARLAARLGYTPAPEAAPVPRSIHRLGDDGFPLGFEVPSYLACRRDGAPWRESGHVLSADDVYFRLGRGVWECGRECEACHIADGRRRPARRLRSK